MKNTIYLDIEDDITAIISKLKNSESDSIKLVPAKRSTVFTSVVNLKLLKKAAQKYKKDLALITDDSHLKSLAGRLDIKVAKTPKEIPAVPEKSESVDLPSTNIGEFKEDSKETEKTEKKDKEEAEEDADDEKTDKKLFGFLPLFGKKKGDHSTSSGIPNFRKFRKKLILGILLLFVLFGGVGYAMLNAPRADVTLEAQSRSLALDFEFVADQQADVADTENSVVPAKAETITKKVTSKFEPTGEKNVGDKSTGIITISNCANSEDETFVKGTRFKAPDGKIFISTSSFTVEGATFVGGNCAEETETSVSVQAEERGDVYNLAPTNYDIVNYEEPAEGYSVEGNQMSGGSTEIVKVVTESDINNAKQALLSKNYEQTQLEFANRFEEEIIVLDDSFTQKVDSTSSTPKVGEELKEGQSEATLELNLTYFQFAIDKNQLEIIVDSQLQDRLDDGEKILDYGIENAEIELVDKLSQSRQKFSMDGDPVVGPGVEPEDVAKDIAGMGYSEAIEHAENYPHVTKALVDLSPFWVFSIPDKPEQINVKIQLTE